MPDTALFVVDVQNGLANSASEIPHAARVRKATETILERARGAQIFSSTGKVVEIYFVQHEEPLNNDTHNLASGTDAWKLVYSPREDETLVSKNTCCTFESNPDLANQLRAQGVHTVVICGIQSEWCVRATSLGALRAEFNVVLLQGAHSTYNDPETGKSATQWEHDVEEELQSVETKPEVKLSLAPWEEWKPTNVY